MSLLAALSLSSVQAATNAELEKRVADLEEKLASTNTK